MCCCSQAFCTFYLLCCSFTGFWLFSFVFGFWFILGELSFIVLGHRPLVQSMCLFSTCMCAFGFFPCPLSLCLVSLVFLFLIICLPLSCVINYFQEYDAWQQVHLLFQRLIVRCLFVSASCSSMWPDFSSLD